ncbi:MAG: hypothetical protein L3J63_00230, partial [Geopsychrobacter sp.]|nr:hypothetical protein [Geopsychrobacter sp.]
MMQRGLEMLFGKYSVLNRLVLVAVMFAGLILMSATADAAVQYYAIDVGTGSIGSSGMTANWGACGDNPTGGGIISNLTKITSSSNISCSDDKWEPDTNGQDLIVVSSSVYSQVMNVSGQSGAKFYLRYGGDYSFDLGYVSGGSFTSFGGTVSVTFSSEGTHTVDFSSMSGTAPSGSYLAMKVILTNYWDDGSGKSADRMYIGTKKDSSGSGEFSVDETVGATCGATTPNNLNATAASSTQVDLTWTYDGGSNNYYTVYRGGSQIATNVTSGSFTDNTVSSGTAYAYTVRGHNNTDACDSGDSNTANGTTPSCTEVTPSSISFNGATTAAGDFSGSTMVTPVDLTSLQFRITEGTGGGAPFSQTDNFDANNFGNWTPWDDNSGNDWLLDNNSTPSSNVGPSADHSGSGYYVYTESSSGSENDVYTLTSNSLDASAYALGVDFWWNMNNNGQTACVLHVDVSTDNGSSWSAPDVWQRSGDNGDSWVNQIVDLSGYTGTVKVRFRTTKVGSGSSFWNCDTALDDIVISGPARASEVERLAWNPDPQEASSVLANGNSYNLYARGTDPECGTTYYVGGTTLPGNSQNFTWSSCTETATLTLTPIANPITGNVSVIATGTATGIQVGTTPAPTNASGWVYVPVQDDNTTTVSFYATGTGTCGPLTVSQLNVGTNTMVAPTVSAFSVPATVVDTAAPLDVPITTFTATDNVAVSGYLITETPAAPLAGAAGWSAIAPATYTVASYGSYTLYAWSKDAAGNVSLSSSGPVTMSNCTPTVTALNLAITTNPINYPTSSSVISLNAVGGTVTGAQWSSDGGASWSNSGTSYTPLAQTSGSVSITGRATENTCSTQISATNQPITLNYDTRSPQVVPGTGNAGQSALDSIIVTMPYQGDVNGDATFQVDYRLLAGTWVNGTPTLDTGGSPYTQVISGLNSTATYEIRVTYVDVDGPVNTLQTLSNVTMVPWADNPMLHNNLRFSCSKLGYADQTTCQAAGGTWSTTPKHSATGGWGQPSTYAGGITCATCHGKETPNVKRIKANISFPDGSAMPGGGTSASVSLLTVEDGTSDFGDDSTAPRSLSAKVCEACHSADLTQANGVKQHAANQAAASGHYDNADCIKCHQHNAGFRADCTTCHGNPPTVAGELTATLDPTESTGSTNAGKHSIHTTGTQSFACNTCHTGWQTSGEMPKAGNINIGFSAFGSTSGSYTGRSTGTYTRAAGTSGANNDALTCTNYCHGVDASPKWLDTEAAMACGSCHGNATNGAPIETAGDGDLSGAITGKKVGKHVKHIAKYACSVCHNGAGSGTALHVNGTNDLVFDTAVAGASATFTAGTSTCSNLTCHTNQVWDTATPALACNSCHGYPPTSAADATNNRHVGVTAVNHDKSVAGSTVAITSNHNECNTCHGKSQTNGLTLNAANGGDDYLASYHIDNNIEMNGWATVSGQDAQYQQTNFGCAKACHANDAPYQLSDSGLTVQLHRYGAGDCNGCHDAGTGGAPVINAASSHVDADGTGGTYTAGTCTDCHPGGTKGAMHSKNGDANVVAIANNSTVGINYGHTVDTGVNGFVLGGDATTGTTAAQICWNCHDTNGISEWGTNTDTNGGEPNYNFGTLNNSNWTTANWTSATAMFSYKSGAIQSTHAASTAGGAQSGIDPVGAIRCSYCHDVHNTTGPNNKPYLRGAWMGSPYPEDGAPQSSSSYANNTSYRFGAVPRGNSGT